MASAFLTSVKNIHHRAVGASMILYCLLAGALLLPPALQADEDDMLDKVEASADKIKDLLDKYQQAEVNIVKREIVNIRDTRGNPQDCDVAIFYGNGQQARLTTSEGHFEGNFDHKHNRKIPSEALSVRLSNCACTPVKTKHRTSWLGVNEEVEKIREVLKEEIESAGEDKAKEYAEKVFNKLAEKLGAGFAAGASSFLSGFKAGADVGAPVGEYITNTINEILDSMVDQNVELADLNDNAPYRPNVGHAELRGRWGNTFGANPQLQNNWDITVRCGRRIIPPAEANWSSVADLTEKEYQQSPAGQQQSAAEAAARAEQAAAERAERQAEAAQQAEDRRREAERARREAELKRQYEERQRQLKAKAAEIARTCTICDPIRNDIAALEGQISAGESALPGLEQAVSEAEDGLRQAKNREQQARQKLSDFRNPSSSATDVESGRTVTSTDLEVKRQASIEAMDRYRDGEQSAAETSEQWQNLDDPDVINDLKAKAEQRLQTEVANAEQNTAAAEQAVATAKQQLAAAKRRLREQENELSALRAKLEECIKQCRQQALNIARGQIRDVEDLMDYTAAYPATETTSSTAPASTPATPIENKALAVEVNCSGSACSPAPISGSCIGTDCKPSVDLQCSGSSCVETIGIICLEGNCPGTLDYNCKGDSCKSTVDYYCNENNCFANPADDDGIIPLINSSLPWNFPVKCTGAGCDQDYIAGYCYGGACPESAELECPGSGCTDSIEMTCGESLCTDEFRYNCDEGTCSSLLSYQCEGNLCEQGYAFTGEPYRSGAAPAGNAVLAGGTEGSSATEGDKAPVKIEPVVTPKGSSTIIPATSTDINAIKTAADNIAANAGACLGAECPVIDCATAATLLQGLINAEVNLDEMYKWLIKASDDAMAHFLGLNANDILTTEQIAQAQDAQALHSYLHNIGSLLLDLAALGEFFKNFKDGSFADDSTLKRLDGTYEMLKDLESTVSTIGDAYDTKVPTKISDVPGATIGALGGDAIADAVGSKSATPEAIGSAVNDMKSQINDALDIIKDAKEGKTPVAAVGKAVGRIFKTLSTTKMKEREKLIGEYMENLGKNAGVIASALAFLQQTNNRRAAAEDALKAVRAAKDALMACMAKACGGMSLTRSKPKSDFKSWGPALQHFNSLVPDLVKGINGSFSVEDKCPGVETGISLFVGGGMSAADTISLGGNTTLVPARTVTAACPRCQPYADKLALNLTETDYWNAERADINKKLLEAETLRKRIAVLEKRKGENRKALQQINQGIADGAAFGFNWGPGLALMRREAEARGRDLQRQITEMTREAERLEASKERLPEIESRLRDLRRERKELRLDLRGCEENFCKSYDKSSAAVGKLFGELFSDVKIIDVKNVSGNKPYDARDPLAPESGQIGSGGSNTGGGNTGGNTGGGTGGGTSGGGGGVTVGGGGTPPTAPIMVSFNPSSILDRHVVGNSPCSDPMGSVTVQLASNNNFTVSDIQVNGGINGFVEADSPSSSTPLPSHAIDIEFNCASAATTVRNGTVNATITDSVTGETDSISINVTNEVTNLITVIPSGATFIPVSKLTLVGPHPVNPGPPPTGCASSHYHGSATACDGSTVNDPDPGSCGHALDTDAIPFEELDCDNP